MKQNFRIDGKQIKTPTEFSHAFYLVTDMERLANGDMEGQIIARKRKFFFTYEAIRGDELKKIFEDTLYQPPLFHQLTYTEDNVDHSAYVYVGEMKKTLHMTLAADWVWKDISFNLIER